MEVRHMKQGLRRKGIWIAAAAVLISLSVAVYAACPQTLCAKENTQCVRGTAAHYAVKGHLSFTNGHVVLGL